MTRYGGAVDVKRAAEKPETVRIMPKGGDMSEHDSRHLLIRLVCTDMYINRQTGVTSARHQQVRLAQLPLYVTVHTPGRARYLAHAGPALLEMRAVAANR